MALPRASWTRRSRHLLFIEPIAPGKLIVVGRAGVGPPRTRYGAREVGRSSRSVERGSESRHRLWGESVSQARLDGASFRGFRVLHNERVLGILRIAQVLRVTHVWVSLVLQVVPVL